ncbi:MAG: hypothetical protein JWR63_3733 [Conexibacter sp.]|nr:hypothetical protein [Conexibacter sp.]
MNIEHSRSLRLATGVSSADETALFLRQERARVLVTYDPSLPGAHATARVLLTTLRRLPGHLVLDSRNLPGAAVDDLTTAVRQVDSARPLEHTLSGAEAVDVAIAIATQANAEFVRIVPDGYGAQLANDPTRHLQQHRAANGLGIVLAAALAAAEAFKTIVVGKLARKSSVPYLSFCPVTLGDDLTLAPLLRRSDRIDLGLVGTGAVGTAVALILSLLELSGRIAACDPETFGPENRGTYSIGGERHAEDSPAKVDMVAEVLRDAGYDVTPIVGRSTDLIRLVDEGVLTAPPVVICGLDSREARRETQTLWPDHLIDAATGDTGVGLHHGLWSGPCLRCFFPELRSATDPLKVLARATGLSVDRLRQGAEPLSPADLKPLTVEQRAQLTGLVGKPVCGLANALGLNDLDAGGYQPSVPFVSQLAACLAVGRLVAVTLGVATQVNFFQFDALHGPANEGQRRNADARCFCQQRSQVVERVRNARWRSVEAA